MTSGSRRLLTLGSLEGDPERRLCKHVRMSGLQDQGRKVSEGVSQAQVLRLELSLIRWCASACAHVCVHACAWLWHQGSLSEVP